jgi:hypothetical protein
MFTVKLLCITLVTLRGFCSEKLKISSIRTVVRVIETVATRKMPRFTNALLPQMDLLYCFFYGNVLATLGFYQQPYPDRRQCIVI